MLRDIADNRALSTVSCGPDIASTRVSSHLESMATQSEMHDRPPCRSRSTRHAPQPELAS